MYSNFYFLLKRAILLFAMVLVCVNLRAATSSSINVTVVIQKYVSFKLQSAPPKLNITSQDIKNGYVTVKDAIKIEIKSNTGDGYNLIFNNNESFSSLIYMTGLENEVQIYQSESSLFQPSLGKGIKVTNLSLSFKFMLNENVKQGLYDWPLNVSASQI